MNSFDTRTYWENRLSADYDLGGVGHMAMSKAYNRQLYRVRRHVFARTLKSLAGFDPAGARVLDIGSGTGFYVDQWKRAGATRIEGCDITDVAVERLKAAHPRARFHRLDIGDPLPASVEGPFDAVSAMDVFFHIVDDERFERALSNVFSLLRPGGLFLWTDNFLHGPEIRKEHIIQRSLADTRATLREVGFEIIDRQPSFFLMNSPVDSESRLLNRLAYWIYRADARSEQLGAWVGRLLYPIELLLTAVVSESPSTEIMVCRRPANGQRPT